MKDKICRGITMRFKMIIIAVFISLVLILLDGLLDIGSKLGFALSSSTAIAVPIGTCCPQLFSDCIVGDIIRENKYYKREGPCP